MSDSALKQRIQEDVKSAMRAKDPRQLSALRLITAALKQKEVDERIVLDDNAVIGVLTKALKQRRESLVQYQSANRNDLAEQEQYEIDLIQAYLPTQLSASEVQELIAAAVQESAAASVKDMSRVLAILKPKLQGRADMGHVSQQVKEYLAAHTAS
jgi:uncharacterized protein